MKKLLPIIIGVFAAVVSGHLIRTFLFNAPASLNTEEEITASLQSEVPKTMRAIEQNFPEDYQAFISNTLAAVKKGGSSETVRFRAAEVSTALRRKYSDHLAKAPPVFLYKLVDLNVMLLQEVRDKDDVQLCNAVAVGGPGAIPSDKVGKYLGSIDTLAAHTFDSIRAGIDMPHNSGRATEADWAIVGQTLVANGMTEEELQLIANVSQSDPRYCGMIIRFVAQLRDTPGEPGERIRADFAEEIGKS